MSISMIRVLDAAVSFVFVGLALTVAGATAAIGA